ncbi:Ferredoxin--NADP reductase, leaf isozyme 2, chloroplastic [Clarias magur]|uniref:Ferredoxin--NADP reductase, leaf isozyme 2, chloroplastic n=1 Tax=Clarias magur TaxID=1594786 RepID=A0A8J4WU33_CLAMG|nr:Ferredoxin--NADP reductase, leaf isozyme 2, chloroplastic [Clarias magur]
MPGLKRTDLHLMSFSWPQPRSCSILHPPSLVFLCWTQMLIKSIASSHRVAASPAFPMF